MDYNFKVKERHAQLALTIRTRTPVQNLPQVLERSFGAIIQYIIELGEHPVGAPFVIYYNTDMQDLDIEIGFPISKKLADKANMKTNEIPAEKVASCLYIGPYTEIEPTYNALFQWAKDNGHETAGIAIEIYLNDPRETPPQDLKTEMQLTLK